MAFAVIWVLGTAAFFRLDMALDDFLGHAKALSAIHGAIADSPEMFVTPQGSPIDAASIQDLHDEDTALLHGARNHLFVVLISIFIVPVAVAALLVWNPRDRSRGRKPRAR